MSRACSYLSVSRKMKKWDPRDTIWTEQLPLEVAIQQAAWWRIKRVVAMYDSGMTYKNIADAIGVSRERVRQIYSKGKFRTSRSSPIERYLGQKTTTHLDNRKMETFVTRRKWKNNAHALLKTVDALLK